MRARAGQQLRATHPAVTAGYHQNKQHWNTVALDGSLSEQAVADMIEDSYDLVVARLPRRTRAALGWTGDAGDAGDAAEGRPG
jgi:predicted DNA-binding protein (MmcQ/YjbR family)